MVKLGAKEEQARRPRSPRAGSRRRRRAPARARLVDGQPTPTLQVDDGFDRAWRRVGIALDRSGFTVEDRDRAQGLYFVRYVDPKFAGREEPELLQPHVQLRQEGRHRGLAKYRVKVNGEGDDAAPSPSSIRQGKPENGESRQAHRHPAPRRPALVSAGGEPHGSAEAR